jgi:hypothetical protein
MNIIGCPLKLNHNSFLLWGEIRGTMDVVDVWSKKYLG